jgi:tRNA threonylcarbamoyladenosine biosynthesis protein TsaE
MKTDQKEMIVYGAEQVPAVAQQLAQEMQNCCVMTFTGSLGAGKTTLIRELLRYKGIQEPVTSPTFNYVNLYTNKYGQKFYHFDLYRIASLDDFCAAGFDEYLYQSNSWALIEWPEPIMSLLTHDVCHVVIDYCDEKRILRIINID